ncbi:isoprenylcysteine carboxylmethyltransferase family protein [Nocardia puris]|uniref:methyltransferase family protein n=1 Tax=Nocardia puris TaxID=208602 RepID=UPI001894A679|nr:isoprenylcysteine carboxylmethyltransferase family protein [Nocardia puris]MBF6212193.1 isoprenylcysteine carboxylmethyltransferase family protein [Nocardia puris]
MSERQGNPALRGHAVVRAVAMVARRALPPLIVALARPVSRRSGVIVPIAVLSAWTVAEAIAEDIPANSAAARGSEDRGTRYGLVGVHLLAWWVPVLLASRTGRRAHVLAGAALVVAGGGLRVVAVRILGARFTGHVRVMPEQQVCTRGPYSRIRHPSYVGLLGVNMGPALSTGSVSAAIVMGAATAVTAAARVRVEEQLLLERLGEPYRRYAATTPRFVPRLGGGSPSNGSAVQELSRAWNLDRGVGFARQEGQGPV